MGLQDDPNVAKKNGEVVWQFVFVDRGNDIHKRTSLHHFIEGYELEGKDKQGQV